MVRRPIKFPDPAWPELVKCRLTWGINGYSASANNPYDGLALIRRDHPTGIFVTGNHIIGWDAATMPFYLLFNREHPTRSWMSPDSVFEIFRREFDWPSESHVTNE